MPCENCQAEFHIFRMKKMCCECRLMYCSACLLREAGRENNRRRCNKCRVLTSGNLKRKDLMALKVRDLRQYLSQKNINTTMCREKHDLVEMILNHTSANYRREQEEHNVMVEELARQHREEEANHGTPTRISETNNRTADENAPVESDIDEIQNRDDNQTNDPDQSNTISGNTMEDDVHRLDNANSEQEMTVNSRTEGGDIYSGRQGDSVNMGDHGDDVNSGNHGDGGDTGDQSDNNDSQHSNEENYSTEPIKSRGNRASLTDIQTIEDLPRFSVRQLKEILACNHVDFKGCVERYELQERVRRLYHTDSENKKKLQEAEDMITSASNKNEQPHRHLEDNLCKICMDATIDCVLLECGHMVTCSKCGKVLSECPICRQFVIRAVHVFKA